MCKERGAAIENFEGNVKSGIFLPQVFEAMEHDQSLSFACQSKLRVRLCLRLPERVTIYNEDEIKTIDGPSVYWLNWFHMERPDESEYTAVPSAGTNYWVLKPLGFGNHDERSFLGFLPRLSHYRA